MRVVFELLAESACEPGEAAHRRPHVRPLDVGIDFPGLMRQICLDIDRNGLARPGLLTYKSIRDAIKTHDGQNLFCLESEFKQDDSPRAVFVSADVMHIVNGSPWPGKDGRRYARLRALLDSFTTGGFITVAERPFDKHARAILARVDPVEAEVWDFRCLDPNPGIRAFGRFSEKDTFVVLSWNFRENLNTAECWADEVQYCKEEWTKLFGILPPHRGTSVNDYLSYNFRSV
jgi:hypothetical protein